MIARFSANLRRWLRLCPAIHPLRQKRSHEAGWIRGVKPAYDNLSQTSWSIRCPCPGGSGGDAAGGAAPASSSLACTFGAGGGLGSGGFIGVGGATLETFICRVLVSLPLIVRSPRPML